MTNTQHPQASFQDRVEPWFRECFPPTVCNDKLERGDRLLEEVLELLQSGEYPPERVAALRDYVWGRSQGEPSQEVGGTMVTLAAYCIAHALDMHQCGEIELARISQPEVVAKIRAKQATKPTGSALPIPTPQAEQDATPPQDVVAAARALVNEHTEIVFSARSLETIARMEFDNTIALGKIAPALLAIIEALRQSPPTTEPLDPYTLEQAAKVARQAAIVSDDMCCRHKTLRIAAAIRALIPTSEEDAPLPNPHK